MRGSEGSLVCYMIGKDVSCFVSLILVCCIFHIELFSFLELIL